MPKQPTKSKTAQNALEEGSAPTVAPQYAGGTKDDATALHRKPFEVMVGEYVYHYTHIPVKYVDEILFAFMAEQERVNMAMLNKIAVMQSQGELPADFTIGPDATMKLMESGIVQLIDMKFIVGLIVSNVRLMIAETLKIPLEYIERNMSFTEYAKLLSYVKNDPDVINGANILLKNVLAPAQVA